MTQFAGREKRQTRYMASSNNNLGSLFKIQYGVVCRDIWFSADPGGDWFFWTPKPAYPPKRDDSGLPDWLTKNNETYFSELHRTVDDVSAPVGFCLSRRSTGRGW